MEGAVTVLVQIAERKGRPDLVLRPDSRPGAAELSWRTVIDPQMGRKISSVSQPGLGPAKGTHIGLWQSCSKEAPMLGAAEYPWGCLPRKLSRGSRGEGELGQARSGGVSRGAPGP